MKILPLHPEIEEYLKERKLESKFAKQKKLVDEHLFVSTLRYARVFEENPFHPSLKTELLEPRKIRIWSFRVDRKYRAIFIFREKDVVEILDVNDHYQ